METAFLSSQSTKKKQETKLKHVNACLMPESQYVKKTGFDEIELAHEAAAGLCFDDICLSTKFLGKKLLAPLMIAPMTGGIELGQILNQRWAKAAEHFGIAFGVGSQRLALLDEKVSPSFKVRRYAKNALIFANLGAAQIVEKEGAHLALKAVAMIEADALFIHLNPLQEACQRQGDRNFSGLLFALSDICTKLHRESIPVFVREVGFGLSENAARALVAAGVFGLDCAGAGGTSWAKVEAMCAHDEVYKKLGITFGEWGIPTAQSITNVRKADGIIPLIATGGIRTGLDVAKAIALGADIAAMAHPMLKAAMVSEDALFSFIEQIMLELKVAMFASGAKNSKDLKLIPAKKNGI